MRIRIRARNADVGVEDGIIVPPEGTFDADLRIPDGIVAPGLINAHDHLHRNHYGRLGHPPYANAYEWGRDIHRRFADAIAAGRSLPRRDALLRGAWKNLLAGVTTVVHHDAWEPDFDDGFPLRVHRIRTAHSLGFEPEFASADGTGPFAIHLAEGVDTLSADEVREMDRRGLLDADLLAVHAVGPGADGVRRLRDSGAAVVWCPTSNLFLFGRTAPADLLAPGMDVLLGSDSLLTGDGDLLDELRAARGLGLVDDARLMEAVGAVAARRLGLPMPALEPGARADLAVFRRPVLDAHAFDVAAVVADGVLRVLDAALVPSLGPAFAEGRIVHTNGITRWINGSPRLLPSPA
jgi:cytosine/adenosine deaminase-related metal-dependent hydrolase